MTYVSASEIEAPRDSVREELFLAATADVVANVRTTDIFELEVVVDFESGYSLPFHRNTETGGLHVSDLAYANRYEVAGRVPAAKAAAGIDEPVYFWQFVA